MKDTYRHLGMRRRLMETLHQKGIQSERVLTAMLNIPRHFFMDKAFEEFAYEDKAFPIERDQTISQPFTVAFQTELLNLKKREKVMEIGTGSGYQACVLAELGGRVYTIERHNKLYKSAQQMFTALGYLGIRTYFRDGYKGLPEFAPFDKILVTAGATYIPLALKEQLKINGRLVIPVGDGSKQTMYRITRISETEFKTESFSDFKFVPFLKGKVF